MLKVFEISRMTNKNGPGIRTLVHFKGCPLRCRWCSTPESQRRDDELRFRSVRCIEEGSCIHACPNGAITKAEDPAVKLEIDHSKCTDCFECLNVCHAHALEKVGKTWSVDDLVKEIRKDEVFFQLSGGGVTFSGGEPLMYVDDEMEELYGKVREAGISIGVDTTGYVPWESIERLLPYIDFFLWDLKIMDTDRHKEYTGVNNELILENLKRVEEGYNAFQTKVYIRCVQIPGMTDDSQNLRDTCAFLKGCRCIEEVDLINYHALGRKRYQAIQRPYPMGDAQPLKQEMLAEKKKLVESMGFRCRIT